MGCSREEMARRLNLRLSQVTALEEDRYQALPGDTFTVGYLRSYARALKLDETTLLKRYRALRASAPAPSAPAEPRRRPVSLDTQGHPRHWGVAAALVVVVALWGWQRQAAEVGEVLPLTPDADAISLALPGGLDQAMPFGVNPLDSVELLPASPIAEPVVAAATRGVEPQAEAAPAADRLNLHFSADCWVEIKDRDNKVLVAMLKRADEQLQIEGRGPFKVLLGFAPGVEMAYNGQPVDIDVPNGARAARLIVGSS
jgi:cytoskeleton protein RodZ